MILSSKHVVKDIARLSAYVTAVMVAASITLIGCDSGNTSENAEEAHQSSLLGSDWFSFTREVQLEENESVVNVLPEVRRSEDVFYVADSREAQFRLYGQGGELITSFGSRGEGPGEFREPIALIRHPTGSLFGFDRHERMIEFTSAGDSIVQQWRIPSGRLHWVDFDSSNRMLIGGTIIESESNEQLHIFDYEAGEVLASFFEPELPDTESYRRFAGNLGFVHAFQQEDTIAAVYSLSDRLYLFDEQGTSLGGVEIPFPTFTGIEGNPPQEGGMEAILKWMSGVTLVTTICPITTGGWLVQYQHRDGPEIEFSLLGMSVDGELLFDERATPRLLLCDPANNEYVFVHPESFTADRWIVAEML